MKVRLLTLLGLTAVPAMVAAQGSGVVFYNKGKMSIVSTNPNQTTLFIDGDFVAASDPTDKSIKSEIFVKNSKTVLTGDLYQDSDADAANPSTVFKVDNTPESQAAKLVFAGTTKQQKITTRLAGYSATRKGANYVSMPSVEIANPNGLTVIPELSAEVHNLDLAKGKLTLESRRITATDVLNNTNQDGTVEAGGILSPDNATLMAHLKVNGTVTYNRTDPTNPGIVEVNLAMDPLTTGGYDEKQGHSIIGMGSPFKEIKADYFTWNTLLFPEDASLFGSSKSSVMNPKTSIPAGKGIIVGVDLKGTDEKNYFPDQGWIGGTFAERNVEMYTFNRFKFDNNNNQFKGTFTDAAYTQEELNTGDIQIKLAKGYNYYSNPYTAPLSLKNIIDGGADAQTNWKVIAAAKGGTRDIFNRAWVLNPSSKGSMLYDLTTGSKLAEMKINLKYSFLLLKNSGSTYTDGNGDGYTIAPLQMFMLYAPSVGTGGGTATSITIPANQRKINAASHFLRSANVEKDDFLFQVTDKKSNNFDRVAVVIRTPEEIMTNVSYSNVPKLTGTIEGNTSNGTKSASEISYSLEEGKVTGQSLLNSLLYTRQTDGKDLESQYLGASEGVKEVTTDLFLTPNMMKNNDITIKAMRLDTKQRVSSVWLKDKLLNKEFDLSSGKDYATRTQPTDDPARFQLIFKFSTSSNNAGDEITDPTTNLSSHYADGTLTISGLQDSDNGSSISIFDIQGRMLRQAKVLNTPTETVNVSLTPGAYILKVVGKRSYVSKFLVK